MNGYEEQESIFSREELIAELHQAEAIETPPLEAIEFGDMDFDIHQIEQFIYTYRGLKEDFGSGQRFWIATLRAQGWEGSDGASVAYAESGLCRPIGGFNFRRLVSERSVALRKPLPSFLGESTKFIDAQQMYDEWNEVSAVAETDDSFVAFLWGTCV